MNKNEDISRECRILQRITINLSSGYEIPSNKVTKIWGVGVKIVHCVMARGKNSIFLLHKRWMTAFSDELSTQSGDCAKLLVSFSKTIPVTFRSAVYFSWFLTWPIVFCVQIRSQIIHLRPREKNEILCGQKTAKTANSENYIVSHIKTDICSGYFVSCEASVTLF